MALIELPLRCSAFGVSISFPLCYQRREKCEKYSLIKLIEISLNNWIAVWKPVVEEFPVATLKAIPILLKQVEKILLNNSGIIMT